ncbi:OsWAK receptor-like protein kinase, partial [Musa troglodytarum]
MGWVELLLLLLKLSSMGSTKAEIASTKAPFDLPSNCTKRCGTIDIEYPFGIGTGCYREGFNLTCTDNTTKPLRLFLVFVYDYYNSTTDDLQGIVKGSSSEVETALSWYIKDYPTCEEAKKNTKTYACINPNSDCYDVINYAYTNYNFGYICRCSLNHKGNPYLANGCTDIDECSIPNKNVCNGICRNTMGGYECLPDKKQTVLCENKKERLVKLKLEWYCAGVVIGVSLGSGLLLLSIIDETTEGTSRNYSLEKEFLWSLYNPRERERDGMGWVELLLLLLKLSSMGSTKAEIASTKAPFALPSNCTKRCGTIDIEYPFGIGTGCYREGFNLTCTYSTTKPPRLFLGDGKLEITGIDLDNGTVGVKTPIITMGVDQEFIDVPVIADVVDPTINRTVDTCTTRCTSYDNSQCTLDLNDWNNTSSLLVPRKGCPTECGGVNIPFPFGLEEHCYRNQAFALTCNKTSNPPTLLFQGHYIVHNISLEDGQLVASAPNGTTTSYSYGSYTYDYDYLDATGPFTQLEQLSTFSWVIESQNCEEARQNERTFACVGKKILCVDVPKTSTKDIWGYRCNCAKGYQGNPYISDGCKDIDECSFPNKYVCNGTCRNTIGGYECLPDKRQTCENKRERLVKLKHEWCCAGVIIGVSTGSGLLLLSISFITLRRKWKTRKQKKI